MFACGVGVGAGFARSLLRAGSGDDERLKWDVWPGNKDVRASGCAGAGLRAQGWWQRHSITTLLRDMSVSSRCGGRLKKSVADGGEVASGKEVSERKKASPALPDHSRRSKTAVPKRAVASRTGGSGVRPRRQVGHSQ
jgi:hypothetical protein